MERKDEGKKKDPVSQPNRAALEEKEENEEKIFFVPFSSFEIALALYSWLALRRPMRRHFAELLLPPTENHG